MRRRGAPATAVMLTLAVSAAPAVAAGPAHVAAAITTRAATPAMAPVVRAPTRATAWTARVVAPTRAFAAPGIGRVVARLPTRARWNGGPVGLLVLRRREDAAGRGWLRVLLPRRPNGTTGWVLEERVVVRRTPWRIDVSTARRTVALLKGGRVVTRTRAVLGAPGTPTPRGRFAVSEIVRQPTGGGFLGTWAVHLTAFSDVLDDYGGGPGRVAIHGRAGASLFDPLGSLRSHGCIRVPNGFVGAIARNLPEGAPVTIRR